MRIERIIHREINRIKVEFPYNQHFATELRKINHATWSRTHRAWLINDDPSSWLKLKEIFPEFSFEENSEPVQKIEDVPVSPAPNRSQKWYDKTKIYIEVIGRRILIKMPKNEIDIKFITSFKYHKWEKEVFVWSIPHYPGNLEMIKNYFDHRIFDIKIHEQIETKNLPLASRKVIHKNEVLVFKTNTKRLKILFGYIPALSNKIKTIPYHTWDAKNKWWSIPYSEQFLKEIKEQIAALGLVLTYEEQEQDLQRVARITAYDIPNYRTCPAEYSLKLTELRYSPKTIKLYVALFEEFINHYPTHDIKNINEAMIIQFLRFLVIERKVSTTYQNQSINAIKYYYEKVLGGQRKFYFIDRPIKEKTLPTVLSTEEVSLIIRQVTNIKHKAILMVIYSAGLRISEAVNLKIKPALCNR